MARKRRPRPLRIYAGTLDGRMERVVAARNQEDAMRSLGVGRATFVSRFRVTRLSDYEEVLKHPCTVYHRPLWGVEGDPFTPEDRGDEDREEDTAPAQGRG